LVTPIGSADPVEEVKVGFENRRRLGVCAENEIPMADNSLQRTSEIAGRSRPYRTAAR
jgi:hypothetical protein